jgi:DNA-binding NarL/FixJ family response regulator
MSEAPELLGDVRQPVIILSCGDALLRSAVASMLRTSGYEVRVCGPPPLRQHRDARKPTGPDLRGTGIDEATLAAVRRGGDLCLLLADQVNGATDRVVRRLHAEDPRLPILVLGAHEDQEVVLSALHAGARGFVSLAASDDSLLCALEAAMSGCTVICSEDVDAVRHGLAALGYRPGACHRAQFGLTKREHQILCKLAANRSTAEIAASLCLAPKTVENALTRVYAKLNVHSRAQAVALALHDGLADPSL